MGPGHSIILGPETSLLKFLVPRLQRVINVFLDKNNKILQQNQIEIFLFDRFDKAAASRLNS